MTLNEFNSLSETAAAVCLTRCCAAPGWIAGMLDARPFHSSDGLLAQAESIWSRLDTSDYLAAFAGHPRIGDRGALRERFAATADLAGAEQGQVFDASEQVLLDLETANQRYEQRFGFIFIVCASGKSADEMLSLLLEREQNDPLVEVGIAASEQARITALRLQKLLDA